jgi:hypothetical protein
MKKWIYLIVPCALLGLFLVFYFSHEKESQERERMHLAKAAEQQAAIKKQKQIAEEKAKQQAAETQKQREEEERKKEEDRRAKKAKADKDIKDAFDRYSSEADKSQKESQALEIELDRLRKEKDALGRAEFDLAKRVEAARVDKRNAELEEQRFIDMIAKRSADSMLTRMPPPPAPAPAR